MKRFIPFLGRPPLVPVIRLQGGIGTGRNALSDATLAPVIEKAFRMKPAAVALAINSPGGSPVQSSLIAARIRRLAAEWEVKVYSFVEEVAASLRVSEIVVVEARSTPLMSSMLFLMMMSIAR